MINSNFDIISWVKDGAWVLPKTLKHAIERLMLSPLAGTFVAYKMRNPLISVVHPLIKLFWFVGYLDSRKA